MKAAEVVAAKEAAGGTAETQAAVQKAQALAQVGKTGPATVQIPDHVPAEEAGVEAPGAAAPATDATPAPVATPEASAPATQIDVDGQTLTHDQIRQMVATVSGMDQTKTELATRERTLAEARKQVEGLISDALSNSTTPPDGVHPNTTLEESSPPAPNPTAVDTTPLTDVLEPITTRIATIERESAIHSLRQRFGDIDEQAVRATMDAVSGISAEGALTMVVGTQTLHDRSAAAGEQAATRVGEAARTETTANAGVVPTETIDVSSTPWEGLERVALRVMGSRGERLLVPRR